MIQVLTGEKGSGKTKRLITIANQLVLESKGHLIYISNNSEGMFELSPTIRLIDTSQFPISSFDSFVGFIYGILSEDYDIETMFIDNLNSILGDEKDALPNFFEFVKKASEEYGIKFVICAKSRLDSSGNAEIDYIAV